MKKIKSSKNAESPGIDYDIGLLWIEYLDKIENSKSKILLLFLYFWLIEMLVMRSSLDVYELLLVAYQKRYPELYSKRYLREKMLGMSKPTFNKYFDEYLEKVDLKNKRKLTAIQVFKLFEYWAGPSIIPMYQGFKRSELAIVSTGGSLKLLKEEFSLFLRNNENLKKYKTGLIPPFVVLEYLDHIDWDIDEKSINDSLLDG